MAFNEAGGFVECPVCGSTNVECDEVDIGVGVGVQQIGPYGCLDCGWVQEMPDSHHGDELAEEEEPDE